MLCPSCGKKNNDYHLYCYNCGTPLTLDLHTTDSRKSEVQISNSEAATTAEEKAPDNSSEEAVENLPKAEDSKDSASNSQNSLTAIDNWDDWWELDKTNTNFDQEENSEEKFNYQDQLPLRRYRKSEKEKDENKSLKLIRTFISIVLIAFIGVLIYIGYGKAKKLRSKNLPAAKLIDIQYIVEETELDGMPARKISIESSTGEQIKLLNKTAPILNDHAEFILPDRDFALAGDYEENNGAYQVTLTLTALADGYPERTDEIYFEVPVHNAPLDILSPSSKETQIDGDTIQLILKVLKDSSVIINDNNYTHLLDDQGQLSVQLQVPNKEEAQFEIKVSAKGFSDNVETIIISRRQMEFPLTIDQSVPIQAAEGEWVKISGNTHPDAVLSTNLKLRGEPELDTATGDFSLYVKATAKGYTPFVLTAKLEGKDDSQLEMVIERPMGEHDYTSAAWASDYQELISYPNLHNGTAFAFSGNIKDIQSTGTKTILLVDVASQGQNERLIHLEYWKPCNFNMNQKIRIFGNHWGSKNDIPYILAYYIY